MEDAVADVRKGNPGRLPGPMSRARGTGGPVGAGRRERGTEPEPEKEEEEEVVVRRGAGDVDGKRVSGSSGSPSVAAVAACGTAEKYVTPRAYEVVSFHFVNRYFIHMISDGHGSQKQAKSPGGGNFVSSVKVFKKTNKTIIYVHVEVLISDL